MVKLFWQAKQGQPPSNPDWTEEQVDQLNQEWFEAYHARPVDRVMADFIAVRKQTSRRVEVFTDKDLE